MKDWTKGFTLQEKELIKLYLIQGHKMKDICKLLGCGDWKVRTYMKRAGLVHHSKIYEEQRVAVQISVKRKYYKQALRNLNEIAKIYQ